jgi:hypothetical protein
MKSRIVLAALLGAALASSGAMHSAGQDGEKKAPVKAAPKKEAPKQPEKKEAPKQEQKKAEQKKTTPGTPVLIAQFGDWGVYVNKTAKTCFALTQPKERLPANVQRQPAYFFVTTRPNDKLTNEVSIMAGFPLKEDEQIAISSGGANFPLFVKGNGLWIKEPGDEAKLLDALKKEKEITLKLTPAKGAVTTDRYSLTGLPQALERVAKECP